MNARSLNPNHAVVQMLDGEWMKLAALLVHKAGGHAVITLEQVQTCPDGLFLTVQELADGIHLTLVDQSTAEKLARQHGGLPS